MKQLSLFAILCLTLHSAADDFVTVGGKKIVGTLTRVDPDGIVIETDSGIEKVSFGLLTPADRLKYGYSQAAAIRYAAATNAASAARQMQADAAVQAEQRIKAQSAAQDARASAPAAAPQPSLLSTVHGIAISGEVIQRTADGLLLATKKGNVWLEGFDAKEGKHISVSAIKAGNKSYTSVAGADTMIDLYRFMGK